MELETAQALARLGMIPTRSNDYGQDFGSRGDGDGEDDMGASLRDTSADFLQRIKSGVGIGAVPGYRKGKGPQRLLDQGELNLGRMAEVAPNQSADFSGVPVRLLDLRSDSDLSQFATVTFSVLPILETKQIDFSNYGGPLVGIVEFGNGSGLSTVEVDIKRGYFPYNFSDGAVSWAGDHAKILVAPYGGTSISVPGSSIRVYAKNDANYRPFPAPVSAKLNDVLIPMKVMAHVSYGARISGLATRTVFLMNVGDTPPPDTKFSSGVPPFARSFYVQRFTLGPEIMPAVNILIRGYDLRETYSLKIPQDVPCPVIPLPDSAELVVISFPGPAQTLTNLSIVYNIGV